jgi:integrase
MHKIDRIRLYQINGQQSGIGYYNGKLVEFMVKKDGKTMYEEITLVQSLEWIEAMHYAEARTAAVVISYDAGALHWFRDITAALKGQKPATPQLAPQPAPPPNSVTLIKAVEEWMAAKENANLTKKYIDNARRYFLNQFICGREGMLVAQITFEHVESWMAKYKNAYTRQTWLNRLSSLLSFSVRRGWIPSNPCDRIDRVRVDRKPPAILTPAQVEMLLNLQMEKTQMRSYFILGTFAGIRPEEILRLDWSAINIATRTVKVDGKTRRRRIVPLEPRSVELLKEHVKASGPLAPSLTTVIRWRKKARKLLGLSRFPQDLLRHTAASYLLALHKDAGKVATMLGNSSNILLTHYHEPVTEADCKAFWGL